jgi:hypothetical protein
MLDGISAAGRQVRVVAAQYVAATPSQPAQLRGTIRGWPVFSRMVRLDGGALGAAVETWWTQTARHGTRTTCGGRFQVKDLRGDVTGGWRMTGRVKRLTRLHWVPVVVELWPRYTEFAMLTMTPRTRVLASKRYFRLGHRALEDLWTELSWASSGSGPTAAR